MPALVLEPPTPPAAFQAPAPSLERPPQLGSAAQHSAVHAIKSQGFFAPE
jgi:hypothetical protein